MVVQFFFKSTSPVKVVCARRVIRRKYSTQEPQTLCATVCKIVARATRRPGLAHSWSTRRKYLSLWVLSFCWWCCLKFGFLYMKSHWLVNTHI